MSTKLSRPALAPSMALLCGVFAADGWAATSFCWPLTAALLTLVAWRLWNLHPDRAVALCCVAVFATGIWVAGEDQRARQLRREALFANGGDTVETHFRGVVLGTPVPDEIGHRRLLLRGCPEPPTRPGLDYRVLLRIAPSGSTADDDLDRLRSGDTVRVWCRLRAPRPAGNPGIGDGGAWLRARGLDATGRVKSTRLVELIREARAGPGRWAAGLKQWARRRLDRSVPGSPELRAFLGAVLLGDRAALPPEQTRGLRDGGLIHLVAISGLHVGLISLVLLGALRRTSAPAWAVLAGCAVLLFFFASMVGPRPSVSRAVLTAVGFALGRSLGRSGDPINTLALLAATLVALQPGALWDAGLQLSFLATAGIVSWSRKLYRQLPLPSPLAAPLAVSASAYVATLPTLAWHFGWLSPICLLSNVPALPLCAVVLGTGYASILLSEIPLAGALCGGICERAASGILQLGAYAGGIEGGNFAVARPSPILVGSFYAMVLLLGLLSRQSGQSTPVVPPPERAAGRRLALTGLATAALAVQLGPVPSGSDSVEALVLDVGQGQAVALCGPGGRWLLVDAGGSSTSKFDPGERIVRPSLLRRGVRRLDVVVVSHGDADHAGGAFAILRGIEVGELWLPPGWHRRRRLSRLAELAVSRGTALLLAERGNRWERAGLPVEVLGPGREDLGFRANDRSIVLRAGVAPCRLLIPGDLEADGERALRTAGVPLSAEALIVSHHGSRTGSDSAFLRLVDPTTAVVSCGYGNPFGHPHRGVLDRLNDHGVRLWRTDRHGQVRLRAAPEGWKVETYRLFGEEERHRNERDQKDQ